MTPAHPNRPLEKLLRSLVREFFQTETSAVMHCRREAARIDATPAAPMLAIAQHAEQVLREFPPLAKRYGLPFSAGGIAVGAMFSNLRDKIFDKTIRSERSYRGTVLGVRHGVDLVQVFAAATRTVGYTDLTQFFETWLTERKRLVAQLEPSLSWFAEHPEQAMKFGRSPLAVG